MNPILNKQAFMAERLSRLRYFLLGICLCCMALPMIAQEEEEEAQAPVSRPVRATFESGLIADNQTVMVPIKNTFEFDIQHRFGTMDKGAKDLYGLYASSNIRLGLVYTPIENLSLGFGFAKYKTMLDFNAKYSLLKQYKGWSRPVSITYYGNIVFDPRNEADRGEVYHESDRLSYFHQLIIARKITNWLSLQVAPSLSHYNLQPDRRLYNDHFAVAVGGQVKLTPSMFFIFNVDQPLTVHRKGNPSPNPNPNINLGIELSTSAHSFQIFLGNYNTLVPQENNVYFQGNNYDNWNEFWNHITKRFRIGFNITRLWNF